MEHSDLEKEVDKTINALEGLTGHHAINTRRIIENRGVVDGLAFLVSSAEAQNGFVALRDNGLLDISFEKIVIRNSAYFSSSAIDSSKWRLEHAWELERHKKNES